MSAGFYPRISRMLMCEPWCIRPDVHANLVAQLEAHVKGAAGVNEWRERRGLGRMWEYDAKSGHGLLRVHGVIGKGLSSLDMECGGVCLDQVSAALGELEEMGPRSLTLHLTSPGGTVTGLPEAAEDIARFAREVAPVYAYADTECCSAAYWLASAADTFTAAPSATVGSIGVYCAVVDSSRHAASRGLNVHLIGEGKYKGVGTYGVEVTEEQLEFVRERVRGIAADFRAQVRAGRKGVKDEDMEGQWWDASRAPKGLHDGLERSLQVHLAQFLRGGLTV